MGKIDYAELFYSQPSLLEGFARILDVGGVFDADDEALTSAEADRIAMMSDWYAVDADLNQAIRRYSESTGPKVTGDSNAS